MVKYFSPLFLLLIFLSFVSFGQKNAKPCSPTINGLVSGNKITRTEFLAAQRIEMPSFCNDSIVSYEFTCSVKGDIKTIRIQGSEITPEVKSLVKEVKSGNRLIFESISTVNLSSKSEVRFVEVISLNW